MELSHETCYLSIHKSSSTNKLSSFLYTPTKALRISHNHPSLDLIHHRKTSSHSVPRGMCGACCNPASSSLEKQHFFPLSLAQSLSPSSSGGVSVRVCDTLCMFLLPLLVKLNYSKHGKSISRLGVQVVTPYWTRDASAVRELV